MEPYGLPCQGVRLGITFNVTNGLLIQPVGLRPVGLDPGNLGVASCGITPSISVQHYTCIPLGRRQRDGR